MKEQIKELRVKIDGLSQLTKGLKILLGYAFDESEVCGISKETEKAYDSLILAKAWLGKVLGELGTESPYKAGYKTVADIEPTADVSFGNELFKNGFELLWWKDELNHIEKVDWLRQEIEKLSYIVLELGGGKMLGNSNWNNLCDISKTISFQHLSEARFWLGFELQRIKENK
jgi:hypothetical protein